MPIFEYHCNQCDKDFELIVYSADTKPECPHCASQDIVKKFSSFAVSSSGKKHGKCNASDAAPCAHGGCGCGSGCCCH
jgi:putative FmdB family regulatory protein